MVWVIEFYNEHGDWVFLRDTHGVPMWFAKKSSAQIALRTANDLRPARYRITNVRD